MANGPPGGRVSPVIIKLLSKEDASDTVSVEYLPDYDLRVAV